MIVTEATNNDPEWGGEVGVWGDRLLEFSVLATSKFISGTRDRLGWFVLQALTGRRAMTMAAPLSHCGLEELVEEVL